MSKELEALKRIETTFSMNKQDKESVYRGYTNSIYPYYEDFDLVLNALQRLESIDNSNPSEALECLEEIKSQSPVCHYDDGSKSYVFEKEFDIIKQALLKQQELENTFADCHICEIQKEFAKYDKLCEESKCDECALGVGDGVCLRKTFERKWELQKEVVSPNSTNLLMQELECKDFADLRKYARCGYEKINNFKGSKKVKIEIPESSLMDYNPVKKYLIWEDLEFKEKELVGQKKVKLGDNIYYIEWFKRNDYKVVNFYTNVDDNILQYTSYVSEENKQFFNDLHLEVVEE